MEIDQRTNRRAFDQRVSLVLKKCVESLDGTKTGQKRPANRALLELLQMRQKKEETTAGCYERLLQPPDTTYGQKRKECLDSYGDESFSGGHKKRGGGRLDSGIEYTRRKQFEPLKSNVTPKKKASVEFSANRNGNYRKTTERTDLFVSDISQNPQKRQKTINLHTSNIRKWSNAVETIRTLRRYIKNEATETNELLISYMLSIDFPLLQTMYKFIRTILPGTSEISELDALTKDKILIAMDAIELWDKKRKELSVPDFVNDLFAQVSSIEGFIKRFLGQTSDDSSVEPVLLALMAHAFGLKIEHEWKIERIRPKYQTKAARIS